MCRRQCALVSELTSDVEVLCLQLGPHVKEGEHDLVQVSLGLGVVGVVVILIVRVGKSGAHRVVNEQHVGCRIVRIRVLGQVDSCHRAGGIARLCKLELQVEGANLQQIANTESDGFRVMSRNRSGEEKANTGKKKEVFSGSSCKQHVSSRVHHCDTLPHPRLVAQPGVNSFILGISFCKMLEATHF